MGATHIRDHVGLGMTFASKTLWRRRAALRVGSWGGAVTGGGRCMLAGSGCSECESDRTVRTLWTLRVPTPRSCTRPPDGSIFKVRTSSDNAR